MMGRLPFALFVTVIHKHAYKARYGDRARNPYDAALEYSFERILQFMESHKETALPVIAEARGKNEDNDLRASFHRSMTESTYYNKAERFRKLTCPISFRRKQDNIAGVQLADLCAHPVVHKVLKPDVENRPYAVIEPKFYRSGYVFWLKGVPQMKTAAPGYTRRRPPNGHSRSRRECSAPRPFGEALRQEGAT